MVWATELVVLGVLLRLARFASVGRRFGAFMNHASGPNGRSIRVASACINDRPAILAGISPWLRALSLFDPLTLPNKPLVTEGHRERFRFAERSFHSARSSPLGMSAGRRILLRLQAAAQRRVVGGPAQVETSRQILIDRLSFIPLHLELFSRGKSISFATGFVVANRGRYYLVTNWHVLSGRNADDEQPLSPTAALPDQLRIRHHASSTRGAWVSRSYSLADDSGELIWSAHPNGRHVDVAVLPITKEPKIELHPLDLSLADADVIPQVAQGVSIVGYPFGLAAGGSWPIWKRGHIATDPEVDYDNRPAFLIDATTRGGMSGAPVLLVAQGGYWTSESFVISKPQRIEKFLGVYSGRIHPDSEVGRIWRPNLISEILAAQR